MNRKFMAFMRTNYKQLIKDQLTKQFGMSVVMPANSSASSSTSAGGSGGGVSGSGAPSSGSGMGMGGGPKAAPE